MTNILPGVYGADVPMVDATPTNAATGNGPLAGLTDYFSLNLVNFDWVTWHDYEWSNWIEVDALLNTAIGFLNLRGIWRPNTAYVAGESVYDPADTTKIYLCEQSHTSSTNFETDKPLYWQEKTEVTPPVTTVFGRIGDVVADPDDYANIYAKLSGNETWTGSINIQGIASPEHALYLSYATASDTRQSWAMRLNSSGNYLQFMSSLNNTDWVSRYRFENDGALRSANSVVTQGNGDGRYQQAGDYVEEAPNDGVQYVRQNKAWSAAAFDATQFVKKAGDTMTGSLTIETIATPVDALLSLRANLDQAESLTLRDVGNQRPVVHRDGVGDLYFGNASWSKSQYMRGNFTATGTWTFNSTVNAGAGIAVTGQVNATGAITSTGQFITADNSAANAGTAAVRIRSHSSKSAQFQIYDTSSYRGVLQRTTAGALVVGNSSWSGTQQFAGSWTSTGNFTMNQLTTTAGVVAGTTITAGGNATIAGTITTTNGNITMNRTGTNTAYISMRPANGQSSIFRMVDNGGTDRNVIQWSNNVFILGNTAASYTQHNGSLFMNNSHIYVGNPSRYSNPASSGQSGLTLFSNSNNPYISVYRKSAQSYFAGRNDNGQVFQFRSANAVMGHIERTSATSIVYVDTSDERLKSDVSSLNSVLDDLMLLEVSQYMREGADHPEVGLLAQQVRSIPRFANLVHEINEDDNGNKMDDPEPILGLNYKGFIPYIIQGLKDVQARLDALP